MKYFTKEWYEAVQISQLHLMLTVTEKAESFSEVFFKQLYKQQEKIYLDNKKEGSEVIFEDIFPEEFYATYPEGTPLDESEFEKAREAYFKEREQARVSFENIPAFDLESERKFFKQMFLDQCNSLTKGLPNDILQKVADVRVLALNYASREVKQALTKYGKQLEKRVYSADEAYQEQYRRQFKSNAPAFIEELSLHDCVVLSCRKKGKDVILQIDHSGGFTQIKTIRMKNCTVIKQDAPLHGAWCLYEEKYKAGDRYEIHFLLYKKKLIEYIVTVDDLEYQYD